MERCAHNVIETSATFFQLLIMAIMRPHWRVSSYFTHFVEQNCSRLPVKPFRVLLRLPVSDLLRCVSLNRFIIRPTYKYRVHTRPVRRHAPCSVRAATRLASIDGSACASTNSQPTLCELTTLLIFWSIFFEVIGPFVLHKGVSDKWDVVAYTVGGIAAWLWWNREVNRSSEATRSKHTG